MSNKHYLILDKSGYKKDEKWVEYTTWFSGYPICKSIESAYDKIVETISSPYFSGAFEEYLQVPEDAYPKLDDIREWFSGFDAGLPYEWAYEYEYFNHIGHIGFEIWAVHVEEDEDETILQSDSSNA